MTPEAFEIIEIVQFFLEFSENSSSDYTIPDIISSHCDEKYRQKIADEVLAGTEGKIQAVTWEKKSVTVYFSRNENVLF